MRKAHRPARPADEVQPRSGRRLCRRRRYQENTV